MSKEKSKSLIVGSMSAVGKIMGVSATTVARDWVPKGMPGVRGVNGKPGRYPIPDIIQWRESYLLSLVEPQTEEQRELRDRLELAQVRKMEAQATIEELKLAQAEKRLCDVDVVIAQVEEMFHRVRNRIMAIPQEVGTTFPPEIRADLIADLRQKLILILHEIADWSLEEDDELKA